MKIVSLTLQIKFRNQVFLEQAPVQSYLSFNIDSFSSFLFQFYFPV